MNLIMARDEKKSGPRITIKGQEIESLMEGLMLLESLKGATTTDIRVEGKITTDRKEIIEINISKITHGITYSSKERKEQEKVIKTEVEKLIRNTQSKEFLIVTSAWGNEGLGTIHSVIGAESSVTELENLKIKHKGSIQICANKDLLSLGNIEFDISFHGWKWRPEIHLDADYIELISCESQNGEPIYVNANLENKSDSVKSLVLANCQLPEMELSVTIRKETKVKKPTSIRLVKNNLKKLSIETGKSLEIEKDHGGFAIEIIENNKIEELNIDEEANLLKAEFGLQEKIGLQKRREVSKGAVRLITSKTRSALVKIKKTAMENENKTLEMTINYYLAKCDETLVLLEEKNYKDKLIMLSGKWFSNHGTSWIKPVGWIALLNFFIVVMVFSCMRIEISTSFQLFFELFNPLKTIDEIVKVNNPWHVVLLSLLTAFNKLVYAICVYEFVRVVRRFTRK